MEELFQTLAAKRPLTLAEAEGQCPGLRGLHRPGRHPFLTCQLVRVEVERIKVAGTVFEGEFFGQTFQVTVSHLVGFGPTWRAAIAMVKEKESNSLNGGLRCP